MNPYLKNLKKIEFVVTNACTGKCKHCSEGDHDACGERIDPLIAADAVKKIAERYPIQTVMTFGGEPLLATDAVYSIMRTAKKLNIPRRQIITNGYFNALERLGMNAKIDAKTFTYNDLKLIKISKDDIWNAMKKLADQKAKIKI